MANTAHIAQCILVAAALSAAASLPGCRSSRTTYSHTCRDGFVSRSTDREEALRGCDAHGGALSPHPEVSTSRSGVGSSRRYKSSYKRSTRRKK